jgi:PEP-CTERM motif-containing protein
MRRIITAVFAAMFLSQGALATVIDFESLVFPPFGPYPWSSGDRMVAAASNSSGLPDDPPFEIVIGDFVIGPASGRTMTCARPESGDGIDDGFTLQNSTVCTAGGTSGPDPDYIGSPDIVLRRVDGEAFHLQSLDFGAWDPDNPVQPFHVGTGNTLLSIDSSLGWDHLVLPVKSFGYVTEVFFSTSDPRACTSGLATNCGTWNVAIDNLKVLQGVRGVPEPSTLAMLLFGLLGFALLAHLNKLLSRTRQSDRA